MIQNISFKGIMPVEFYAKNPKTGKYVPVVKPENVKKCQNYVVKNLNGTKKPAVNDEFVRAYREVDKDYAKVPVVKSYYDKKAPKITSLDQEAPYYVYLITGTHVDGAEKLGKELGMAKKDAFEATGKKDSPMARHAQKSYADSMEKYVKKLTPRIKDENGDKMFMRVFFEPKYTKKGDLKDFEFKRAIFWGEDEYNEYYYGVH